MQLLSLINEIKKSTIALANVAPIWDATLEAIIHILRGKLSAKDPELHPLDYRLSEALRIISFLDEENRLKEKMLSEQFTEFVCKYFNYGVNSKWKSIESPSLDEQSLLDAFFSVPFQSLSSYSIEQYAVVVAMFAARLQLTNERLFLSSIHILGLLASTSTAMKFFGNLDVFDSILSESLSLTLQSHTDAPSFLKDASKFLSGIIHASSSSKSLCKEYNAVGLAHYLCPALTLFKGKCTEIWSWTQMIRFSAVIMTTKWKDLAEYSEPLQMEVTQKIRKKYVVEMLHNMDWNDTVQLERYGVRLTSKVISGAFNLERIVVEQALMFQLKYLPIVYEGSRRIENVVDWKVLLYLQFHSIPLDSVILALSVEKILKLLSTCLDKTEVTYETLDVVAKLISPRLKSVAEACIASLVCIFEKAENCTQLLSCAANAIESFGRTNMERDVTSLCLTIASTQQLNDARFDHVRELHRVIKNAILHAHYAVNNDQCAVFA
ncbi:hypothetical protein DICVIV_03408 [Dictyocaulus viviparus]|uniref:Uncharacterized protein n=1 Tax=Dictyocaulus viviparus TaxID=29172 RepID=A0A0D8Y7A6_DICVI|nr:hypothetical protein DICVIV_03408 [Dictyocaulus viviparus]